MNWKYALGRAVLSAILFVIALHFVYPVWLAWLSQTWFFFSAVAYGAIAYRQARKSDAPSGIQGSYYPDASEDMPTRRKRLAGMLWSLEHCCLSIDGSHVYPCPLAKRKQ